MYDAPYDENGIPWESTPPPKYWDASARILGSSDARLVTWLDITAQIANIEGLVAPPPEMEVFDLDGIKVVPSGDHAEDSAVKKAQDDANTMAPRYMEGGETAYDNMSLFTAWRKEQEKTTSIGTPPPASFVPPERRELRPTRKKSNFTPEKVGGMDYKSDEMDGAIPHTGDGKVDDVSTWESEMGEVWRETGEEVDSEPSR
ncbi:MAG: hypothetical protein Q9200_004698 [Gallowayella weberi]